MKVYKAKIKGNESQKMLKRKEIKAQKAKMKGNESPKAKIKGKAQKAKMKGNKSPNNQNERK